MYKLLVVEDEVLIRDIIKEYFATRDYEVIEAVDGYDALNKVNQDIDMVLLDIMMPGMDGYETCKKIREKYDMPIIFISALSETDNMLDGYHVGADDYITKPFNILEVKARIKAIMRRTGAKKAAPVKEQVIENGDLKLDLDSRRLFILGREVNLTAREFELLELFVTNQNKVFSREKLLQLVWGADYPGDVRTVDVHVRRLREKIETNPSEPKYVHTKWGVGYYYRG